MTEGHSRKGSWAPMDDEPIQVRVEDRTHLTAYRGRRILWRWRARKQVEIVGVADCRQRRQKFCLSVNA